MTTSQALEAITDRGIFENLATSVLRKQNGDYSHLIQTGMNASGETIKSPVDGLCLIPGSIPSHYLLLAHTTIDIKGLKGKWQEDLDKASMQANQIRQNVPDAVFTLILTTNQRVSLELLKEIDERAQGCDLIVDKWEQSRFADFLDTTADGHWLRQMYLGMSAVRLSLPLLEQVCEESRVQHQRTLPFGDAEEFIPRGHDELLRASIGDSSLSIILLLGEAGFGKTSSAQRIIRNRLEAGALAIWVQDSVIAASFSVEEALDRALRAIHPALEQDAGRAALALIPNGTRLLIVVDDLNRGNAPQQNLRKMAAWVRPSSNPKTKGGTRGEENPILLICPTWPRYWAPMSVELKDNAWLRTIQIGKMTEGEGIAATSAVLASAGIRPPTPVIADVAERLGSDPFLIGLFGVMLTDGSEVNLQKLAEDVIGQFISLQFQGASSEAGSLVVSDYRASVADLALQMLRQHELRPTWQHILRWDNTGPDALQALRELVRQRQLCSLDESERLVFRHDRIREAFLTHAMANAMSADAWEPGLVEEPFYAEIVGRALVQRPLRQEALERIVTVTPLALAEAIRVLAPERSIYRTQLITTFKQWAETNMAEQSMPDAVRFAIYESMIVTSSSSILDITANLQTNFSGMLARFRNGCAKSGAEYCSYHDFMPSIHDRKFEDVLMKAKEQHVNQLVEGVKRLLVSPDVEDGLRGGAICIAGYLEAKELEDCLPAAWLLIENKPKFLAATIWATCRCFDTSGGPFLDQLLTFWDALPDEKSEAGWSDKEHIATELKFAFARGVAPAVVDYFDGERGQFYSLKWLLPVLFSETDSPRALTFTVHQAAAIQDDVDVKGGVSPWLLTFADHWNPSRPHGHPLSPESRQRLRELWQDTASGKNVQWIAFCLWLTDLQPEELATIQAVPATSVNSTAAIMARAKQSDFTVLPEIIPLVTEQTRWFDYAANVWGPELQAVTEARLASFADDIPKDYSGGLNDNHYALAKYVTRIPAGDAEGLLEGHWSHLGYSPMFVQAALFIGTPKCLALASLSINRCREAALLFRHVGIHWESTFGGRRKPQLQHFSCLEPYLDWMTERELSSLAVSCHRAKLMEWGRRFLQPRMGENHRKRLLPTDDDIRQQLTELADDQHGRGAWRVPYILDEWFPDPSTNRDFIRIVDQWLQANPGVKQYEVAAMCVQTIGSRKDLGILDKILVDGDSEKMRTIREGAEFVVYRRILE